MRPVKTTAYLAGVSDALHKLGFVGALATKLAPLASKALSNVSKVKMPSVGSMATDVAMGVGGKAIS